MRFTRAARTAVVGPLRRRLVSTTRPPRAKALSRSDNPRLDRIAEAKAQALEGEVEGHSTTGALVITMGMVVGTGAYAWYLYGAGLLVAVGEFARGEGPAARPEDALVATVKTRVYLDVAIGRAPAERIVVGLFDKALPKTSFNFATLAKRPRSERGYVGTPFHRIIPGFMIQGGDTTTFDGRGGESCFGGAEAQFGDEALTLRHTGPGVVAMANSGPDTNGSQFFITLRDTPWLDGKHVIFGRVVEGMDVVERIAAVGSPSGAPSSTVVITACGIAS